MLLIPNDHFSFSIDKKIDAICKPLAREGIVAFFYARLFYDKTALSMGTDAEYNQYHVNETEFVLPPVSPHLLNKKFYFIPKENSDFQQTIDVQRTQFGYQNSFIIAHFQAHYIDMFFFGTRASEKDYVNCYFNKLDYLNKFSEYYKRQANHLILESHEHKFNLADKLPASIIQPQNLDTMLTQEEYRIDNGMLSLLNIKLTSQEQHCLDYLALDYSASETAERLGLSARTIQDYINSIVRKLGCQRKKDIVRFCYRHQLLTKN